MHPFHYITPSTKTIKYDFSPLRLFTVSAAYSTNFLYSNILGVTLVSGQLSFTKDGGNKPVFE